MALQNESGLPTLQITTRKPQPSCSICLQRRENPSEAKNGQDGSQAPWTEPLGMQPILLQPWLSLDQFLVSCQTEESWAMAIEDAR